MHLLRRLSVRVSRLRGTGLPRLSYLLFRHFQRKGGNLKIADFQGNLRLSVDLSDHMGGRIFWFDAYSGAELNLIQALLKPGDVFVDAGANIGEFTLVAARSVGPAGKVIAIEPVPDIRERLERHISDNRFNSIVDVIPHAVGDKEETVSLYAPPSGTKERHQGLPTIFQTAERSEKIAEAKQITIDSLALERVSGIKLDIEGAEIRALRGAAQMLNANRPWIICEMGARTRIEGYDAAEIFALLDPLGYSYSIIEEDGKLTPIGRAEELRDWQNVFASPQQSK